MTECKAREEDGGEGGELGISDSSGDVTGNDSAEEQRHTMRVALAKRMKRDLIEREQERVAKV